MSSLKRDDHDFVSYKEILNLLLKNSITTTEEPPRDSKPINSINIHNNSNKGSAVTITNDDRDVNNNSVTETNKSESSNAIVIVTNQEGGMVMPTRKHSQKMSVKRVKQKRRYIYLATVW